MNRRNFLRFLGIGMAAASLSPGQLLAEIRRPAMVAMPTPVIELVEARMLDANQQLIDLLTTQLFKPRTSMRLENVTAVSGGRVVRSPLQWASYYAPVQFAAPGGLPGPYSAS